jgi:hypothetical protein
MPQERKITDEFKDNPTPVGLIICPECGRKVTHILQCDVPDMKTFLGWSHLCLEAKNSFRWCGTFGQLHLDIFKLAARQRDD